MVSVRLWWPGLFQSALTWLDYSQQEAPANIPDPLTDSFLVDIQASDLIILLTHTAEGRRKV